MAESLNVFMFRIAKTQGSLADIDRKNRRILGSHLGSSRGSFTGLHKILDVPHARLGFDDILAGHLYRNDGPLYHRADLGLHRRCPAVGDAQTGIGVQWRVAGG